MTLTAAATPSHAPSQLPPTPGLARRMACWLYEGLLLFSLMMVAVLLQSALALLLPALNHPAWLQASSLLLWGAYFVWFWQRGQTLPMKTWRIRILDPQGRPIGRARALSRYALSWVWGLPLLLQISPWHQPLAQLAVLQAGWVCIWALLTRFERHGQFWHDIWAGTRLVSVP